MPLHRTASKSQKQLFAAMVGSTDEVSPIDQNAVRLHRLSNGVLVNLETASKSQRQLFAGWSGDVGTEELTTEYIDDDDLAPSEATAKSKTLIRAASFKGHQNSGDLLVRADSFKGQRVTSPKGSKAPPTIFK